MTKQRKYQTTSFYCDCVPEDFRTIITKQDFYSQLNFLMNEITKFSHSPEAPADNDLVLETTDKRIVYAKYIQGKTIKEIMSEFVLTSSKHIYAVCNRVSAVISSYIYQEIAKYPVRFGFLKIRRIYHKPDVREVYRSVPTNNITVKNYIDATRNYIEGKYDEGYLNVLNKPIDTDVANYLTGNVEKWFKEIYDALELLYYDTTFVRLVSKYDGTRKSTLTNAFKKFKKSVDKFTV